MGDKTRKIVFIGLLIAIGCFIFVMNWLSPYASDDYFYSYSFVDGERITSIGQIIPSLIEHGVQMNGRYAPHFFVQLFTMLPEILFDVVNTGVYLLLLMGMYMLVRGQRRYNWMLMLILFGETFIAVPDFGGSMLWLAGACNYLWCGAACAWLLVPFANQLLRGREAPNNRLVAVMTAGALWMGNCSENMSAVMVMIFFGCAVMQWIKSRRIPWWMLIVTAATFVGWLFLVLAPGDSARISRTVTEEYGLSYYVNRFLDASVGYQRSFLMPLTLGWIYLFGIGCYKAVKKETLWFSAFLFAGAMVCNGIMFIANYYPYRTVLWPVLLLLMGATMLAIPLTENSKGAQGVFTAVALHITFLTMLAAFQALPDNYDRYCQFNARMEDMISQRDAGIMNIETFGIEGKSKYDEFYGVFELTTDPEYRINVALSKHLGVDSIIVNRFE